MKMLGFLISWKMVHHLAGEVEAACVFQPCYRPCLTTLGQLEEGCLQRETRLVLGLDKKLKLSTELDSAVLEGDNGRDLRKDGLMDLGHWRRLEQGATISQRFPAATGGQDSV